MLEFLICSLLTIFPDYLVRRYVQGKRVGREINLYSMWFELRYGITACLILTISLITMIFYFHPSTSNVTAVFRTVTIMPESTGRVAEVYVDLNEKVSAGAPSSASTILSNGQHLRPPADASPRSRQRQLLRRANWPPPTA